MNDGLASVTTPGSDVSLFDLCTRRSNLRRAAATAIIVGPVLTLINQTGVVVSLAALEAVPKIAIARMTLTFAVPFLVSLVSSALADRARNSV